MVNMSKWQQQQTKKLYSEEQMDDAYDKGFNEAIEKMYSEEEVLNILNEFKLKERLRPKDKKN